MDVTKITDAVYTNADHTEFSVKYNGVTIKNAKADLGLGLFKSLIDAKVAIAPYVVPDPMDSWDEITLKIAFNHENRIRALESKAPITVAQFKAAVKAQL